MSSWKVNESKTEPQANTLFTMGVVTTKEKKGVNPYDKLIERFFKTYSGKQTVFSAGNEIYNYLTAFYTPESPYAMISHGKTNILVERENKTKGVVNMVRALMKKHTTLKEIVQSQGEDHPKAFELQKLDALLGAIKNNLWLSMQSTNEVTSKKAFVVMEMLRNEV